VIRVKS